MTISEVCEKLGLSHDTLRFYEKIALIPAIKKNAGGFREYTEMDYQRLAMIKWMRAAGMSIEILGKYIRMARDGSVTLDVRKKLLLELRCQLDEKIAGLQEALGLLDEKIECYEVCVAPIETKLFSTEKKFE